MDNLQTIQYQVTTTAPPGAFPAIAFFESAWHQPWSEPVRVKPALRTGLQQAFFPPAQIVPTTIGWFSLLSEPVRLKPRLPPGENPFCSFEPGPPVFDTIDWYGWLSEPKRFKLGLAPQLQHYFEAPPRLLPTFNITGIMSAKETNLDVFLGAINVYNASGITTPGTGAKVSISEQIVGGDPVSIRED